MALYAGNEVPYGIGEYELVGGLKGKPVEDALSVLGFMPQRAAKVLVKVIRSAVANADQKPDIEVDSLTVGNIVVNQGPSLKRFRPRAMGRATRILKRTSHITVTLSEAEL